MASDDMTNGTSPERDKAPASTEAGQNGAAFYDGSRTMRPMLSFRARTDNLVKRNTEQHVSVETPRYLALSGVLLTVILSLIMSLPGLMSEVQISAGMPANQDIFSPTYLRYESQVLTERAREAAMKDTANEVWVHDTDTVQQQYSTLIGHLTTLDSVRSDESLGLVEKYQRLSDLEGINLTQAMMDTLLGLPESDYWYWKVSGVIPAYDAVMRERRLATPADVEAARAEMPNLVTPTLSAEAKAAAVAFVAPLLKVNVRLDEEQTRQRSETAASNVRPVVVTVQKGEVILRQGELATPVAMEKMQQAGLLSRNLSVQSVAGTTGIVALLMLLLHLYIFRYASQVWHRHKQLLLVAMLLIVTVAVARIFLPGHAFLPYMLPLAAVSMLIAVLLHPNLAVMVTFVSAILVGMAVGGPLSLDLPVYYFVGGLTGIFTLTRIERVSTFALAGFGIAVASFLTALLMKLLAGSELDWPVIGMLALAAAFNGGMSTSITYAAFSLLGTLFGITTPLQLMELAHPDQPLLRRLMHEAPGTYHHSLVVSNLAERAAEMVGGDPLLARVCAYYHDIGKVERPYYFTDNQSGMNNIHDELDPHASAKIIADHVLDGVRLARKHRLPKRVIDAIPQHHGTMLIKYFYHKALQQDPGADPDDFRYPGPKPQTKENAILMLADGVEATVRSMAQSGALDKLAKGGVGDGNGSRVSKVSHSDATEGPLLYNNAVSLPEDAIASVVHKVISERIEDGQLDECDLTVRDIAHIQEAFVGMLKGIYHPRVSYPEAPSRQAAVGSR